MVGVQTDMEKNCAPGGSLSTKTYSQNYLHLRTRDPFCSSWRSCLYCDITELFVSYKWFSFVYAGTVYADIIESAITVNWNRTVIAVLQQPQSSEGATHRAHQEFITLERNNPRVWRLCGCQSSCCFTINTCIYSLILYSALATAIAVSRHSNHAPV